MPCSICKHAGHSFVQCNDDRIEASAEHMYRNMYALVMEPAETYSESNHHAYPSHSAYTNIKTKMNRLSVGWHVSLWKRAWPLVMDKLHRLDGYSPLIARFRQLTVNARILRPTTSTDYKLSLSGLAQFIARQLVDRESHQMVRQLGPNEQSTEEVSSGVPFYIDSVDVEYIHDDGCAVCMEPLGDTNCIAFACLHGFCARCVGEFMQRCNGKCPSCREIVSQLRFKPTILPEHFNKMNIVLTERRHSEYT